ncbi:hypothetical protein BHAOGJBA_5166 [Methylobacterium hispanicum]|uniref:Uncharacterized protein n=1 Tax=Methylobacterium hispanicum TaxID=270350 RepID=A0AAV4ZU12_9HYPH|nr:hypothetical protein [Methylobacterium hispanicum]GJD91618.1 hypothetical protein BHAOGJBA_5166 [Methylobacterium hispanicum]
MKYRITVGRMARDERGVAHVRAADPAAACVEAIRLFDEGRLSAVGATCDPKAAYVVAVTDAAGGSRGIPSRFGEGAAHLGVDWPKSHAVAVLLREMEQVASLTRGSDAGTAIDVLLRTFINPSMKNVARTQGLRDYSVAVARFEKANVLETEVEAESVVEACTKAIETSHAGALVPVLRAATSDAFALAIVEGIEHSSADLIERSLDVPAPWSEGWRLHAPHLQALELFEAGARDALQGFRIAVRGREDLHHHVERAEAAFASIPAPSTASAAPSI